MNVIIPILPQKKFVTPKVTCLVPKSVPKPQIMLTTDFFLKQHSPLIQINNQKDFSCRRSHSFSWTMVGLEPGGLDQLH